MRTPIEKNSCINMCTHIKKSIHPLSPTAPADQDLTHIHAQVFPFLVPMEKGDTCTSTLFSSCVPISQRVAGYVTTVCVYGQ